MILGLGNSSFKSNRGRRRQYIKRLYGFLFHSSFREFETSVKIKAVVNPNLFLVLEFIVDEIH